MVRISSNGPFPAFFAAPMWVNALPPPYATAPRNMLISRALAPTSVMPMHKTIRQIRQSSNRPYANKRK